MSAIIIDGEVVHYEALGRGRPLIFLHGWLSSWRYWIPVMQARSVEFRTYALDLWGFGDTSKRGDRYSLDAQADLLRGFMDRMAILKAAFIGHGLGAATVLRFARRRPQAVDRIMAVSMPLSGAAIAPRLLSAPPPDLVESLLGRGRDVDPIRLEAAKTDPEAVASSVRLLQSGGMDDDFRELKVPCLLVHGERDPLIAPPPDGALQILGGNVRRIGLDDSRHFPMLEEAAKFDRLLADFLSLRSGEDLRDLGLKEEWVRRVR